MDEAKKSLIKIFYQNLCLGSILCVLGMIVIIFLIVLLTVKFRKLEQKMKIAISIVIPLIILLETWMILFTVKYIKDIEFVKNRNFIQLEGELIGFAHSWSNDTEVWYSYPIIKSNETKESMIINPGLIVQEFEIGSQYTFIYLPHTKLAKLIQ